MGAIEFTQFLLPNGRRQLVQFELPDDLYLSARRIKELGYQFEVELLTTGMVSMEILNHATEDVLAHELTANGPPVVDAVHALVKNAVRTLKMRDRSIDV